MVLMGVLTKSVIRQQFTCQTIESRVRPDEALCPILRSERA